VVSFWIPAQITKNREKRSKRQVRSQAKRDSHLSSAKEVAWKSSAVNTHSGEFALTRPYTLTAHCSAACCRYNSDAPSFACTAPLFQN